MLAQPPNDIPSASGINLSYWSRHGIKSRTLRFSVASSGHSFFDTVIHGGRNKNRSDINLHFKILLDAKQLHVIDKPLKKRGEGQDKYIGLCFF